MRNWLFLELNLCSRCGRLPRPILTEQLSSSLLDNCLGRHNVLLLAKGEENAGAATMVCAAASVEHGWSRAVLTVQIQTDAS